MLQSGWSYEGRNFGTVGTEFQLATGPSAGISLFADAQINDNSHFAALGGLKVTFGKNMTLKDRHRRQDPDSYTFSDQQTTQQGAAAANARQLAQQGRTPALTTTPACPSGGALFSPTLNCTCPTGTTKNTTITLSGTQASCGPATNL